jgi:hypothetical protein
LSLGGRCFAAVRIEDDMHWFGQPWRDGRSGETCNIAHEIYHDDAVLEFPQSDCQRASAKTSATRAWPWGVR